MASDPVQEKINQTQKAFAELKLPIGDQIVIHKEVLTAETHAEIANLPHGVLAKNLFLKDKKKGLWLITAATSTQINLSTLAKQIKETGGSLRLADEDSLLKVLNVKQGAVTPVALCNDKERSVNFILDKVLADSANPTLVHPLSNQATIAITADSLLKFANAHAKSAQVFDFSASVAAPPAEVAKEAEKQKEKPKKEKKEKKENTDKNESKEKEVQLGIEAKKHDNFADWYQEVVVKSEMIDYYDISGCYILRPYAYKIWQFIQEFFNTEIEAIGVENAYFPLFISSAALNKEKDHIAGFAPEVAWVTKAGSTELEEPIAVRPTSETIMYPAYAKWIRSHRDLPLRLNQWANVVRWEFKNPTPFIRSREFLWQEGHSAFATKPEADQEVLQILDLYAQVYERLLACPVIKGKKTENEKFAGGDYTTTVEAFIPETGRGIQGATSHCLGQNFSKMFQIQFEDTQKTRQFAWQNSWGLTTRTIGVMVMQHADDKGLVLPPAVAPVQVIIVPLYYSEGDNDTLNKRAHEIEQELKALRVRVKIDLRTTKRPGWKFAEHELKGIPVRVELGPKDMANKTVNVVRRDTGAKEFISWDRIVSIPDVLATIQREMLERARTRNNTYTRTCRTWAEFMAALDARCRALIPWCGVTECEKHIKEQSGLAAKAAAKEDHEEEDDAAKEKRLTAAAKSLCIPFDQPPLDADAPCVGCGKAAILWCLFGRSY